LEAEVINDLIRILGPHGFDPEQDVEGVYINRWGHAMVSAYPDFAFGRFSGQYDPLENASKPYGAIAFAHTDLDGTPYLDAAVKQGRRAAKEITESLGRR
jgi:spermidine dehydrogenase